MDRGASRTCREQEELVAASAFVAVRGMPGFECSWVARAVTSPKIGRGRTLR